jgi:hypothetical protein
MKTHQDIEQRSEEKALQETDQQKKREDMFFIV